MSLTAVLAALLGCGSVTPKETNTDGSAAADGGAGDVSDQALDVETESTSSDGRAQDVVPADAGACPSGENTRTDCRDHGTALLAAQYACHDDGYNEAIWGTCGSDGKLVGYYAGLPCPFDVGIVNSTDWAGPCPECTDSVIITNGGGSTSAVWRNTSEVIYCCDNTTVRKIARCK
jgi:hypothetical protein